VAGPELHAQLGAFGKLLPLAQGVRSVIQRRLEEGRRIEEVLYQRMRAGAAA
jgi:hypothetical protein